MDNVKFSEDRLLIRNMDVVNGNTVVFNLLGHKLTFSELTEDEVEGLRTIYGLAYDIIGKYAELLNKNTHQSIYEVISSTPDYTAHDGWSIGYFDSNGAYIVNSVRLPIIRYLIKQVYSGVPFDFDDYAKYIRLATWHTLEEFDKLPGNGSIN